MNIGVLASHNGTNLQAMIDAHDNGKLDAKIAVVISNNSKSGALERARKHRIKYYHLSNKTHPDINSLERQVLKWWGKMSKSKKDHADRVKLGGANSSIFFCISSTACSGVTVALMI